MPLVVPSSCFLGDTEVSEDYRQNLYPSYILLLYYISAVHGVHQFLVPECSAWGRALAILIVRVILSQRLADIGIEY